VCCRRELVNAVVKEEVEREMGDVQDEPMKEEEDELDGHREEAIQPVSASAFPSLSGRTTRKRLMTPFSSGLTVTWRESGAASNRTVKSLTPFSTSELRAW
jgi:hypothetical protein